MTSPSSARKPYYITTPLYYVNDKPHIGHAYTNVLCDTFARFRRFSGEEVFFLTGTDEHGEKIDKTAKMQSLETKAFIDGIVPRFKEAWAALGISYDHFIRTTDAEHKETVKYALSVLWEKGDIYKGDYTGWYCTPCESFWTNAQLLEGKCPDCRREVSEIREENYFFRLSKYQTWLREYISADKTFIQPERHRNEVLSFLNGPLEDLCITRPRNRLAWGIPFPSSDDYVIYVWFDALTNYISAAGYGRDEKRFKRLWPADLHVVGKDILRHHAVYWTIMLHALGLAQPKTIFAHGWWTISGDKMSKSLGNIVDPIEVTRTVGVDGLRYYFLHEVTLGSDGAYSETLLLERYHKDLADELGNLVRRSLAMVKRYLGGHVPDVIFEKQTPPTVRQAVSGLDKRLMAAMNRFDPRGALEEIWNVVRVSNRYIEETKPWDLAKDPLKKEDLDYVLGTLLEGLRSLAIALTPFLPGTAERIRDQLNMKPPSGLEDLNSWGVLKAGSLMAEPAVLFPKIETDEVRS